MRLSMVSGCLHRLSSHAMLRVLFCLVSLRRTNCQSMYNVRGVRFVLVAMHEVPYPLAYRAHWKARMCVCCVQCVASQRQCTCATKCVLLCRRVVDKRAYTFVDLLFEYYVHEFNSLSARDSCKTIHCTVSVVSRGSIRNSSYHSGFVILVCFRF
jgi:hypothetical protein